MARISDPHESEQSTEQQPPNGKTIVLAEDDPFISRMYQTKLERAGYKIVLANNGRDAYEQIKAVHPDLVIMDINMPELSGFEVINALIGDGNLPVALENIIVLTNSANPEDRKKALSLSIEYMVKADLTPREVLDHINQKLGLAKA